jgi:hypothetical protein
VRVGAGDPMCGAFPALSQTFERAADTFARDEPGREALLQADLGCQGQCPHTGIEAKVAGAAMQEILQCLSCLVWEGRPQSMGTRGPFLQHRESLGIEAVDDSEHRLPVATELAGSSWGSFAPSGCQQDLAAPQNKGVFGA